LGFDAGCPFSEARTIIVEYLQSLDGAGLPPREAIAGAKELLSVDADTAGLVIEKAPEEVGFVHAVFRGNARGGSSGGLEAPGPARIRRPQRWKSTMDDQHPGDAPHP